ncbi:MAG TPA: hypothetical protein VFG76_09500 [Candidatus Polarisedimenticolia bacterium]|nr:hypothetical protein [Candidatus Polarisedimenticolia bacterium]
MRRVRVFAVLVAGAMALVLLSCAEPPTERTRVVRQGLTDLKDISHAQEWAPDELASAEEAVSAAERELTAQSRRFSWRRDYARASNLLSQALVDIELARTAAQQGRQVGETRAREALDAAVSGITHARTAMMVAPISRQNESAIQRLDLDLSKAEDRIDEVRNLIVAEKYHEATIQAEEILDRVTSIVKSVRAAARP